MATKLTKPKTKRKLSKKKSNNDVNDGSSKFMILAIIGIIVLVYLGLGIDTNTGINNESNDSKSNNSETEMISNDVYEPVIIDGLRYDSREYALEVLREIPQTQRTEEQWEFLKNPDGYKK